MSVDVGVYLWDTEREQPQDGGELRFVNCHVGGRGKAREALHRRGPHRNRATRVRVNSEKSAIASRTCAIAVPTDLLFLRVRVGEPWVSPG